MRIIKTIALGIYRWISDILYVFSYPLPIVQRTALLMTMLRIGITAALPARLAPTRERFLGFRIAVADYRGFARMFREIFVRRVYYFESDNDAPVILDCGGNIGMSVLYFKWLFPHARITVFEPVTATAQQLAETMRENGCADVVIRRAAVGESEGEIDLQVPRHPGRSGGASVKGAFGSDNGAGWRSERVSMERLSSYVTREAPDFVKIDTEGAEGEIISELAAVGALARIGELSIEYHHGKASVPFGAFITLFENAGFRVLVHGDDVDTPIFYLKRRRHHHSMIRVFRSA